MKMFSAGLAVSTALTAAILTLAAPMTWGEEYLFGAYDPRQQDSLWNEAINLQNTGQHSEAIRKLKRAAHLSRINDGLNAKSQLPFLRAEIQSHRALNQLQVADERQAYLSRLEATVIPSGPEKVTALLAQAEWHQYALLSDIDDKEESASRMAKAWNFYRRALDESVAIYGESSEELLPALEGMIRAQYLLAAYQGVGAAMPGQMTQNIPNNTPQRGLFKRGLSVFVAMQQLKRDKLGVSREVQADDLIRMGDWAWWTGNRNYALDFYAGALALASGKAETNDVAESSIDASSHPAAESEVSEGAIHADEGVASGRDKDSIEAAHHVDPVLSDANTSEISSSATEATVSETAEATPPEREHPTFRILENPVALPAVPGFDPVLRIKQGEAAEGDLVVSFNISETGKAVNVERVQFPEGEGLRGPERLIRRLKKMRFRPVFEDGEPVESEEITWVFESKHWANPGTVTAETST